MIIAEAHIFSHTPLLKHVFLHFHIKVDPTYNADTYTFYLVNVVFQFTPLPVWHGTGYRSFGFRFGNICYIR